MDQVRLALGIVAAVLHGLGYYLYSRHTKLGQSTPNIASWSIWAFLATINALTYRVMSGDPAATLQFFMGSIGCMLTFLFALAMGKFSWPKRWEHWAMFILGIVATVVYYRFRNATSANMIVLVAFVISFIPTLEGVIRDPFVEVPRSWVIWTVAYMITTMNVTLNPDWRLVSLLMPVVMVVAHGAVAVLSTDTRKARFIQPITR